jgi:DNA-binding NarL/FixJ family response regulator
MQQRGGNNLNTFNNSPESAAGFYLTSGIESCNLIDNYGPGNYAHFSHSQLSNYRINPGITYREIEVLQLLSDGDSSKMIAHKLHICETTAITHRKNLIKKLNVRNTAHLIKVAILLNIIV